MKLNYIVKINGTELTHLKKFNVNRTKLWTEANRNMEGDLRATLIGIYPKLELGFAPMDADTCKAIIALLDLAFFSVDWWDAASKTFQTAQYYAGDYTLPLFSSETQLYDGFEVSLIPVSKFTLSS